MTQGNESRPLPGEETQTSVKIRPRVRAAPAPPLRRECGALAPSGFAEVPQDSQAPLLDLLLLGALARLGLGACAQGYRISSLCALGFESRYLTSPSHGRVLSVLWKVGRLEILFLFF